MDTWLYSSQGKSDAGRENARNLRDAITKHERFNSLKRSSVVGSIVREVRSHFFTLVLSQPRRVSSIFTPCCCGQPRGLRMTVFFLFFLFCRCFKTQLISGFAHACRTCVSVYLFTVYRVHKGTSFATGRAAFSRSLFSLLDLASLARKLHNENPRADQRRRQRRRL